MRLLLTGFTLAVASSSYLVFAMQPPAGQPPAQPPQPMSFFVTSVGSGNGANLGGIAGADRHCQALATAVGAGEGAARSAKASGTKMSPESITKR